MGGIATQNPPEGLGGGERAPAPATKISTLSSTPKTPNYYGKLQKTE